jgi:hypothetical protein
LRTAAIACKLDTRGSEQPGHVPGFVSSGVVSLGVLSLCARPPHDSVNQANPSSAPRNMAGSLPAIGETREQMNAPGVFRVPRGDLRAAFWARKDAEGFAVLAGTRDHQ